MKCAKDESQNNSTTCELFLNVINHDVYNYFDIHSNTIL